MNEEIFTTVGVYNNGSMKTNGVRAENIEHHIEYNLSMRPGRAFFVNGECKNTGYLGKERCRELEPEIKKIIMTKDTAPYV